MYSPNDHFGRIPRNFPDAGTQLVDLARRLDTVADDLDQRTRDTATVADDLATRLQQLRDDWAAEVSAAVEAAHKLTMLMDVGALISRRDALRQQQRSMVSEAGGTAQESIGEYERGLQNVMRKLADIGYVQPESVELGPGDVRFSTDTGAAGQRTTG